MTKNQEVEDKNERSGSCKMEAFGATKPHLGDEREYEEALSAPFCRVRDFVIESS